MLHYSSQAGARGISEEAWTNQRSELEGQSMESRRIVLDLPLGVLSALRKTPEEFSGEVRLAAAAKWYEMGLLSQEKAAQAAGMCREDFLLALSRFGVSPFQYSHQEILAEAGYDS